jgi:hypothetical protein
MLGAPQRNLIARFLPLNLKEIQLTYTLNKVFQTYFNWIVKFSAFWLHCLFKFFRAFARLWLHSKAGTVRLALEGGSYTGGGFVGDTA